MPTGSLYVVAAPSGTGKTTLIQALIKETPGVVASVSCTTRPPRANERDGVDYRFVDAATFEAMAATGDFLEHAEVFGHRYGTPRGPTEARLAEGFDVVLVIDWQGFRQVRQAMPDCVGVFLLPPSRATLEHRLRGRGQDPDSVIRRRLAEARAEIGHWREFDYVLVNRKLVTALGELQSILVARRLRREVQGQRESALIAELLEAPGRSR
ncbi:MAG: guanylate kinase [Gammaproteobacteria bacterium]|nr:guanylate kinase [Gammaproteobacteria bacterium]